MKRKYINTGEGILILHNPCFGGGIKNEERKVGRRFNSSNCPFIFRDLPRFLSKWSVEKK